MKSSLILTSLLLGTVASSHAGQVIREPQTTTTTTRGNAEITHEFEASYNASASARSNVSPVRDANISEQNTHVQYVFGYAVPERPVLRLGVGYDRYDFGFAGPGLIPGALQSVNLVAGVDLRLGDFLIRIEAQPGLYGDDRGFTSADFNVPVIIGASYLVSKDFQWILGVFYNPNASRPVLGGIGFRWKMADRWTLNFVPPNPRLEFKATDDVTLYAGGQLVGTTFRTNKDFGNSIGRRDYNNAVVDYTEIRAGAGATWKVSPKGALDVELGYMAYRDFDYHKVGDNFQTKSGSFYGQMGLKLNF